MQPPFSTRIGAPGSPEPADGAWTIQTLRQAEAAGHRLKFLFFWGHTPPADGGIGPHVLSQWYEQPFVVDGTTYPSAEHYMMAAKARLFGDRERIDLVLAAKHPGDAKAQGRSVRNFDQSMWERDRLDIVVAASVAKFGSRDDLRGYLVGTGHRVLVEASPRDRIWGIGMGRDDPRAPHPSQWRGQNLLGFALMQARAALR